MSVPSPSSAVAPRIGIVGAGRTRQGLGPFFAQAFTAAGCRVTGVSSHGVASAERAAGELHRSLGGDITAFADAAALARTVDALVVASPERTHLAGLEAALAAGVPCLCEKPLVAPDQVVAARVCLAAFRVRGLLVQEHCQWPFTLPAFFALHPHLREQRIEQVAMGLGPAGCGRSMVEDSLSHVLSVVQALAEVPIGGALRAVRQAARGPAATANVVAFTVLARSGPIDVELHLTQTPMPPRPAWLSVNGCRVDRRIGDGYAQSFVTADGRTEPVRDPLHALVYGFAEALRTPDRERTLNLADAIACRLELHASVLAALD